MGRIESIDELEINYQWRTQQIWSKYDSTIPMLYSQMDFNDEFNTLQIIFMCYIPDPYLTQNIEINFGAVDSLFTKQEIISNGNNQYTWKGCLEENIYQRRDDTNAYILPSSIYTMTIMHSGQPIGSQKFKFIDVRSLIVNVPSNPQIYDGRCQYSFSFRRVTGVSEGTLQTESINKATNLIVLVNNPNDISEWLEIADYNLGRPIGEQITFGFDMNYYPSEPNPHVLTIYSSNSGHWSLNLLLIDLYSGAGYSFPLAKNVN